MSEQPIGTVVVAESGFVGSGKGYYRGKDVHTGDVAKDQYGQKWRVAVASGLCEIDEKLYGGQDDS